ncbi:MAG: VOC family protein [Gemmatimonadales bacterium]
MDRQTVDGIGGVVLFADHADSLAQWYEKHLGVFFTREPGSHEWACELAGASFAIHQSKHPLGRERHLVEISWRVKNLDDFVEYLGDLGIVIDERQETSNGDYVWLDDPEGNRVELWQEPEQ